MFSIIVAINNNGVIGRHGSIPWKSKADLKHFKETTLNSTVIIGRKTFESLRKPLSERELFVITHHPSFYNIDNVNFVGSLDQAIAESSNERIFVAGGSKLYGDSLNHPLCSELIISFIDNNANGDCYFPMNLMKKNWKTIEEKSIDIPNDPLYKIIRAKRRI